MENVVLFNTSISTLNMGDYIIAKSCKNELHDIISGKFVIEASSHTPVTHFYQNMKKNKFIEFCDSSSYKFVLGTNLLAYNMLRPWANFNVNIFNTRPYRNLVLVGCGLTPNAKSSNLYTRWLYKKILSSEYIHSTRDEATKCFLESLGFKAVNTGCATMWKLTEDFCKQIPTKKSKNVVFTLTDYCQDREKDQLLIDCLTNNYEKIYFWIQGSDDLKYFKTFENIDNIELISPSIEAYETVLAQDDIEYVGTRLHAGIYALQHKKRSIILVVDNRSRDIKKNYNIVAMERDNINELEKLIQSNFVTNVNIPTEIISQWKKQFR